MNWIFLLIKIVFSLSSLSGNVRFYRVIQYENSMKKCKKKKQEIEFPVRFIEFLMVPETFGVCLSNSNCQNNNSMRHKSDRINRRQFPCLGFQGTRSPFLQSQCCILVSGTGNLLTINIYPIKESFLVDVKCFTIRDIFYPQT